MLECFSARGVFCSVSANCVYHEGIFPRYAFFPSLTWIRACEKARNCYQYMNLQIRSMKAQEKRVHWVTEHKSVKKDHGRSQVQITDNEVKFSWLWKCPAWGTVRHLERLRDVSTCNEPSWCWAIYSVFLLKSSYIHSTLHLQFYSRANEWHKGLDKR